MPPENGRLPFLVWVVLSLVCLCWIFATTEIRSDISLYLPDAKTSEQKLLLGELKEGPAARLLLLAIAGGTKDNRAAASKQLAKQLQQTPFFLRIENGALQIDPQAEQLFFASRYLLSPSDKGKQFTAKGLRTALSNRLSELRSPVSILYKKILPDDPTGELIKIIEQLQGTAGMQKYQDVWFSDDFSKSLLILETKAGGFDLAHQKKALQSIQETFQPLSRESELHLIISGPGMFGVFSQEEIIRESTLFSIAASIFVATILFLGYRSFQFLLIAALPIIAALIVGTFVVSLFYGSIHGITLAFAITLLGVTIDYPIHLFSHLESERTAIDCLKRI